MDATKWPVVAGLVVGTNCLSRTLLTTFAFEKPLLTYSLLLASAAFAVLTLGRFLPRSDDRRPFKSGQQYAALPLDEVSPAVAEPHRHRHASPSPTRADDVRHPSGLRKLRLLFYILVGAICLRIEVLRHVLGNTQCNVLSWEPLIPFFFACWDYWTLHRHKPRPVYDVPHSSVYDVLEQRVIRSHFRYVVVAGLISFGGLLAVASSKSPDSTFICAAGLSNQWFIPFLQRVGTVLDAFIAYSITQLLQEQDAGLLFGRGGSGVRNGVSGMFSVGWALTRAAQFSATGLFVISSINFIAAAKPQELRCSLQIAWFYVWSLLKLDFLVCVTLICALLAIFHIGLTTVSVITTFVSICTLSTHYTWSHLLAFPPSQSGTSFLAICITIIGFALYFHLEVLENKTFGNISGHNQILFKKKVPSWLYLILLIVLFIRAALWASQSTAVNYHPIDLLIFDAQPAHEAYLKQASSSKTLAEAIKNYKDRYHRHPPPGFDHWYRYATERNSFIIDDFDSIYRDIIPFYALEPAEIRQRTWQIIANLWHNATGISIRDGKVNIISGVYPTHRWMLEGIVRMIERFAERLPDMDLAFNTNDEPRIAAWYEDIEPMREAAKAAASSSLEKTPENAFCNARAKQWEAIPQESAPRLMRDLSWQRIFSEFGAAGCPSDSAARTQRLWNRGHLCTSCIVPQSIGAFLSNWTKAADICHQPDIAYQHGFYSSPATFKASHQLYPVFSQSKVHGFNDILYPSAWNYVDKAKYAPTDEFPDVAYADKKPTLFWRGTTSEGMSPDSGQWKGMTRQRFQHILNNINFGTATQPILVPELSANADATSTGQTFRYTPIPISDLTQFLDVDVHFANEMTHCWDKDCAQQRREFGAADSANFQSHWGYKYLLDLDGAGFSGRFLPFLESRSLPLKAGVFREWWDDRVMAWKHFVPLDVRGQGVWATLAYFAGLEGKIAGDEKKYIKVPAHEREAELIAEQGREWAGKVLRKEDMEIYFFRLLLEWGRVTDDNRDGIGLEG